MTMTRSTYSAKLKDALDDLRPAMKEIGQNLKHLTTKREAIAPDFLKAFTLWRRETHRSLIAFVHELDPSTPVNDRKAYRAHPTYRAAEYILQVATNPEKTKRRGLTPLAMLATTIKSFLPLCGSQREQKEALNSLLGATKWRDTDQRRLLAAIRRARVVALPKVPRLVDAGKSLKVLVADFERERMSA